MTQRTAADVAGYWLGAGGPKSRIVEWVAIAYGESGWNDAATSSVGAAGLWQIMPFNAGPYGYAPEQLYDPAINARIAVAMSGGGTNCAAWDSCYVNINASGRYTFLAWPEVGSADYNNLAIASADLGGTTVAPISAPQYPGITDTLAASVATTQQLTNTAIPALMLRNNRVTAAMQAAYRPGRIL